MNITMKSAPFEVIEIRKTKARFWKDVEVGDVLVFSQTVQGQGMGRGLYAVDLKITNTTKDVSIFNTMNQVTGNMLGFQFKEAVE